MLNTNTGHTTIVQILKKMKGPVSSKPERNSLDNENFHNVRLIP